MTLRIFCFLIVLSWLGSTAWLVRTVCFPGGRRLVEVPKEEALAAFFRWNDTTNLSILENGRRIGQMSVSGLAGRGRQSGEAERGFSLSGTLDGAEPDKGPAPPLAGMTWRVQATFDEAAGMETLEAVFRVPHQDLRARFELGGSPPELGARLAMGGEVLFESGRLRDEGESEHAGQTPAAGGDAASAAAVAALTMPLLGGQLGGAPAGPEGWQPRIEAARGAIEAAGSRLPVYVVGIAFGPGRDEPALRLYLSETGEPIRIESDWGFEAVAEVLIPVEKQAR